MDDDYLNWMCHDVDVDADGGSSDARNQILPVFEREKDHFGSFPGMGARFRILLVKFFFMAQASMRSLELYTSGPKIVFLLEPRKIPFQRRSIRS